MEIKIHADPLYQHFIVTAERKFWRCVETGEGWQLHLRFSNSLDKPLLVDADQQSGTSRRQAARFRSTLISDSAGMPRPSCNRQIIFRVSERRRLSTSWTRLRLPMKGIRSRG